MSVLDEEIRLQVVARQSAMQQAELDGDGLRVAILRAEIEDLHDLARRHAVERAMHFGTDDEQDRSPQ